MNFSFKQFKDLAVHVTKFPNSDSDGEGGQTPTLLVGNPAWLHFY